MPVSAPPNASLEWGSITDFASAAELISLSWGQNRETSLEYTPEFLRSFFAYPGDLPVIAPALFKNGRLAALVGGVPRTVQLHGHKRRLLLMTFFTVAPEYQGQGLGRAVWAECLLQAQAAHYDGAVHYCVEGNRSNAITIAAARDAGLETKHLIAVPYLMRLLRPPQDELTSASVETAVFLQSTKAIAQTIPLARLWTAAEAEWQCRQRNGCLSQALGDGIVTGYQIHTANAERTSCVFIEDILWGNLGPEAQINLLQQFLSQASKTAQVAVVPSLGYANMDAFKAAGFRRSPRLLHAYLTMWNGAADGAVDTLYIDIL